MLLFYGRLYSIVGTIKILSLPKFELIWTLGSVFRMLLVSPNFGLALLARSNRSREKPHFPKDAYCLAYRTIS